jgi:hypothetical protein
MHAALGKGTSMQYINDADEAYEKLAEAVRQRQ